VTKHRDLGNSELHEDKGAASASDMELYFADGTGSGEWKPLLYAESKALSGSSVEFTGLGEFAFIQLDLFNIQKNTTTNHHILVQVGNDSGYTTSSSYYTDYWDSGGDGTDQLTGFIAGWFKNDTGLDSSAINCSTLFITNFNKERYSVSTTSEHMIGTSFSANNVADRVGFIREQVNYNKLRLVDTIGASFEGGTAVLTGWRSY
jgi:hypothetical protein